MKYLLGTLIGFALSTTTAFAQEAASIDTGDTAWMLIATALVMLMTPAGLALFYGGLTQNKHVLCQTYPIKISLIMKEVLELVFHNLWLNGLFCYDDEYDSTSKN